MNWFFILIRTFPFWGIPIGVGMVTSGFGRKGKKWIGVLGVLMIAGGVAFFFYQGHFKAVPFVHDVMNEEARPGDIPPEPRPRPRPQAH